MLIIESVIIIIAISFVIKNMGRSSRKNFHYSQDSYNSNRGGSYTRNNAQFNANQDVLAAMLKLIFEKNQKNIYENDVLILDHFNMLEDLASIKKSIDFNTSSFCSALCNVIRDTIATPSYISIQNNRISNIHFLLIALQDNDIHLTLEGLNFADNQLQNLDFLNQLKKFPAIKELKFTGNPITKSRDYFMRIRKSLPELAGLDGKAILKPILSLPWPVPPTLTNDMRQMLVYLDQSFFQKITSEGVQSVMTMYHENSTFTLSLSDFYIHCKTGEPDSSQVAEFLQSRPLVKLPMKQPNKHQAESLILKDLRSLKSFMDDRNRNLVFSQYVNRMVCKPNAIFQIFQRSVYPSHFRVVHEIDSHANIEFFNNTGLSTAVATIHGSMRWEHMFQSRSDELINRAHFHRTMTFINQNSYWYIVNDLLHLRRHRFEPLLHPQSSSRLSALSKKHSIPVEWLISAAQNYATNDKELEDIISDLQVPELLKGECLSISNNDVHAAVLVTRIVKRMHVKPQIAYNVLVETQGDLAMAVQLIQEKYNSPANLISTGY